MKNEASDIRPMDHATARVVSEMAAALLPPLKENISGALLELEEKVDGMRDVAEKTAEVWLDRTRREAEETMAVLQQLKKAGDASVVSLGAVQDSVRKASIEASSALELLCRQANESVERFERTAEEPPKGEKQEADDETTRLLRSLEKAIPDWEGVLKADGRAQTRELSELSSEMSELLRETKANLLQTVGDILEKAISTRGGLGNVELAVRESAKAMERKLARLEKLLVVLGGVAVVLCLATLVALMR